MINEITSLYNNDIQENQDPMVIREKINKLENIMCKMEEKIDLEPTHYFAKGIYARELFIPKGTVLTGKIHKTEHLNIISKGKISVVTEDGQKIIQAPFTMVSRPGTKRVGYALEDTVWTTIHASNETDLIKLEEELIAKSHEEFELLVENSKETTKEALCLGAM